MEDRKTTVFDVIAFIIRPDYEISSVAAAIMRGVSQGNSAPSPLAAIAEPLRAIQRTHGSKDKPAAC